MEGQEVKCQHRGSGQHCFERPPGRTPAIHDGLQERDVGTVRTLVRDELRASSSSVPSILVTLPTRGGAGCLTS
jgi:hypothetical protein